MVLQKIATHPRTNLVELDGHGKTRVYTYPENRFEKALRYFAVI